jgi:acyl-CoA dehydrogenase
MMADNDFLEPFVRLLQDVAPIAVVRETEGGGDTVAMWSKIAESGFLDALVPGTAGGFGLTLAQVEPLLQALGRHLTPVPVAETMVARVLLAQAGIALPDGPIVLATSSAAQIPFAAVAKYVLADNGEALLLIPASETTITPLGLRSTLSGRIEWQDGAGTKCPRPADGLRPIAAVLRAAMIAGTIDGLLDMTVAYANDRVQFGKPIGRQQAVQQQLAVMAEYAVSARIAAQLGCGRGFPPPSIVAATAKYGASAAVMPAATIAHAVHGAIGISEEYDLQLSTRRLYEWRLADGSESYWANVIGASRLSTSVDTSIDFVRTELSG